MKVFFLISYVGGRVCRIIELFAFVLYEWPLLYVMGYLGHWHWEDIMQIQQSQFQFRTNDTQRKWNRNVLYPNPDGNTFTQLNWSSTNIKLSINVIFPLLCSRVSFFSFCFFVRWKLILLNTSYLYPISQVQSLLMFSIFIHLSSTHIMEYNTHITFLHRKSKYLNQSFVLNYLIIRLK